jgi:uncharacterized membrane protein
MRTRTSRRVVARYNWDRLKVSFWFAPLVMSLGAILLAWAMYWIDGLIPNEILQDSRLVLSGTPGELRSSLIGVATTTLATAGVVFTLLTLPLSTVAAQYGSRLLRVFLGDRTTQLVLGMFAATFIYCLAAALSIPPAEVQPDAPQITATFGLLLMVASFSSLILLVQHISTMLQAPNIAAGAGARLVEVIHAEIPVEVRSEDGGNMIAGQTDQEATEAFGESEGYPVYARDTGYIQYIDPETMLTMAQERNLVIRLQHKPGHFVRPGVVVALVLPAGRIDEQLEGQIRHAFRLGSTRTPTQDIEYAVNQLVEMAVRAMSPAINDPFTAMTCLDYIAQGLALFIRHGEKGSRYYDPEGQLRLVYEPITFEDLLSAAFDMLRHASSDNAKVLQHMLEAIDVISQETKPTEERQLLARHVSLIQAESQTKGLIEDDRQLIQRSSEALLQKLLNA